MKERLLQAALLIGVCMVIVAGREKFNAWRAHNVAFSDTALADQVGNVSLQIQAKAGSDNVLGRGFTPPGISPEQVKPTALSALKAMRQQAPGRRIYVLDLADDERMLKCANYICTATMEGEKVEIRGGLPSRSEILEAKAAGVNIDVPTEEAKAVTAAYFFTRMALFKKKTDLAAQLRAHGKHEQARKLDQTPIGDDEVNAAVAKQMNLSPQKVRYLAESTNSYYTFKGGNRL